MLPKANESIVLYDSWISKIALSACITSLGVAYASDLPITADGWKLVGISPTAEAFWIRTNSIRGPEVDRQVLLAIATPSKGVEVSMAHIDCNELIFYRVLQDGRRSSPVKDGRKLRENGARNRSPRFCTI